MGVCKIKLWDVEWKLWEGGGKKRIYGILKGEI